MSEKCQDFQPVTKSSFFLKQQSPCIMALESQPELPTASDPFFYWRVRVWSSYLESLSVFRSLTNHNDDFQHSPIGPPELYQSKRDIRVPFHVIKKTAIQFVTRYARTNWMQKLPPRKLREFTNSQKKWTTIALTLSLSSHDDIESVSFHVPYSSAIESIPTIERTHWNPVPVTLNRMSKKSTMKRVHVWHWVIPRWIVCISWIWWTRSIFNSHSDPENGASRTVCVGKSRIGMKHSVWTKRQRTPPPSSRW